MLPLMGCICVVGGKGCCSATNFPSCLLELLSVGWVLPLAAGTMAWMDWSSSILRLLSWL